MKGMTEAQPKCLVAVRGKSLLEWQLDAMRDAGVEEIAVVTGYKRELLCDYGLKEFHNPRWAETNMVSSLVCASEWLLEEACIVSYSDIFYSCQAIQSLQQTNAPAAITFDPNWLKLWEDRFGDPLLDAETFRLNPDNTLAEIGRKPKAVEEIQGQYMGLLLFTPQVWLEVEHFLEDLLPADRDTLQMTGMLDDLITRRNLSITAIPYNGLWGEVDSQEDLALYL